MVDQCLAVERNGDAVKNLELDAQNAALRIRHCTNWPPRSHCDGVWSER
jgi:hypothetical protein